MSWLKFDCNGKRPLRMLLAAAVAGSLSLSLGACGFQPLYGTTSDGRSMTDVMKTVEIAPIPGRTGLKLRNELIYGATGGGETLAPVYRMDIILRESVRNTLVTRRGNPTGQVVELNAEFRLVRLRDNEVVFKGASSAAADYDLQGTTGFAGSAYSDIRAQIDAEDRAARSLADTLKTRVAAFLSRQT